MLAMTLDALMHATAPFLMVSVLRNLIAATMRHVEIVTDTLALLVPTTVSV